MLTRKQKTVFEKLAKLLAEGGFEPGDQLPSFASMASELGCTVSVLTRVAPMFVEAGVIEIVDKVGTFLRRRPPKTSGYPLVKDSAAACGVSFGRMEGLASIAIRTPGKCVVRFQVGEFDFVTGDVWRKLMRRFEARNPGIQIHLKMDFGFTRHSYIEKSDMLFANVADLLGFCDQWVEWNDGVDVQNLFTPFKDYFAQDVAAKVVPVNFSFPCLMVNRGRLEDAGLFNPSKWDRLSEIIGSCRLYRDEKADTSEKISGLLMPYLFESGGFSQASNSGDGFSNRTGEASYFRELLQTVGQVSPPTMVTFDDIASPMSVHQVARNEEFLFVHSNYWFSSIVRMERKEILQSPMAAAGYPMWLQHMGIAIDKGCEDFGACKKFAGFIISDEGQAVLNEMPGQLPVRRGCARKNDVKLRHYDKWIQNGWWTEALLRPNETWKLKGRIDQVFTELRRGRIGIDEAAELLKEKASTDVHEIRRLNI